MGLKLSHAFINVADLDRVVPFYTDLLGFRVTDRGPLNDEIEAVFISQEEGSSPQLEIGTVDFLDQPIYLEDYPINAGIGWGLFIWPILAVLGIALLTVSYQTIRAALANPVESLRYE